MENNQMASEQIIAEVAAERERQITQEGWTAEHDDLYTDGELALAAAAYAETSAVFPGGKPLDPSWPYPAIWPWDQTWWKPKNPRRDLVRAAALIVAEIERLDRQSPLVEVEG